MKHANVAIFVPHVGCPNMCSFCNQNSISGAKTMPTSDEVYETCRKALLDLGEYAKSSQIAFFGGSFTAIDKDLMESFLEAAHPFVGDGKFDSIRLSTRPDAINPEILSTLKKYGVKSIELGAQSMCQRVLDLNHRGHTVADVEKSSRLILDSGFELGLQMMVGLYGDTDEDAIETAKKIVSLGAKTVRIYPTIVIMHTLLEQLYNNGKYEPMALEHAVSLCCKLMKIFHDGNVEIIRLGLHASESLEKDMLAGPYHQAFRELCEGELFFEKALSLLEKRKKSNTTLFVNPKSVSKMIGQKKINIERLKEKGFEVSVKPKDGINLFDIFIDEEVEN
ncbi:MAG: radical SAM protein [Oscillospiraceae bacterium]